MGPVLKVTEFCQSLNGLHERVIETLKTPRCINDLNMMAIGQCAGCCLEAFAQVKVRNNPEAQQLFFFT